MDVKLIVVGGKHAGQEVPVPGSKFFIGRAEDCHLRPGSELVSRHHAVILVEEGFVAIRDFGSKNGTYVNGERIKTERELKAGDHLKIGPLEFEVHLAVRVGGKTRPKVHSVQEAAVRTVETVQPTADDDLDVSQWLGGDEDSPADTKGAETQPLSATPTDGSRISDTAAIPEETAEQEPKDKKKAKKKKPPGTAGRLQDASRPTAGDTTSAADDVLRKFFGRRG